ncbi:MAG: hypothetical protein JNM66_25835 [Bryobacterales bacterium]|nr:hypothetical protein [Bryobacterales bacterium]
MLRVVQFGISGLLALMLLLTPIGYCADSSRGSAEPAHPCCPAKPAPLPDDCARPGCIYMDTSASPAAVAAGNEAAPIATPVSTANAVEQAATPFGPIDRALEPPPPFQRFVVFHQFRN